MKRKIVTLCGSMRFDDRMAEIAERLELEGGYAVIGVISHVLSKELTDSEIELLGELHKRKIEVSDAIFVVNIGGYIGKTTRDEIEFARSLGKEIMFLENEVCDGE